MYDFTVLRVEPKDLPKERIFVLNHKYKTELSDFVLNVDLNKKTLWVNKTVPEKDIAKFIEVINFPYSYVCDPDMGEGKFFDYVDKQYGAGAYLALVDAQRERRKRERKILAQQEVEKLIPTLDEVSEEIDIDEVLLSETYSAGCHSKGKTVENIISYGGKYLFLLGYLMGNGAIDNDLIGGAC